VKPRDEKTAKAYVERLVAHRPRTVAEVERRLAEKGFPPDVARAALDCAQAVGVVDDALFARLYADDRLLSRPCSRKLLARELRDRGVDDALAERAARAALPDLSEEDLARQALTARLPLWGRLDPEIARNRAAAFLLRRGFSSALVREAVAKALGGEWTPE
jgi:regulatory protein